MELNLIDGRYSVCRLPQENGWKILKVLGPLDFGLTVIMSSLSRPLADAKISVFTISTFYTDYLLVKDVALNEAVLALKKSGFVVICS